VARPPHTDRANSYAHDLRRNLTISEARVWSVIKAGRTGARFRRQVPIGRWVVDFACLDLNLVIEIDDTSHYWRDETARTGFLCAEGFRVLRFTNEEVAKDIHGVKSTIELWVAILRKGGDPES